MARQEINLGVLPSGVGGDTPRVANTKINDMTAELYEAIEGGLTPEERAKLEGVAEGATKNKPDSELLNRSNHTGVQTTDTISNFSQAVRTTTLSGVALSTSPIVEPDTVLVAMGKLQGQVNQRVKTGDFGLGGQLAPDVSANAAIDTRFYRAYNDADSANLGPTAGIHLQRDLDRNAEISLNWLDESMQFRISNSMGARGKWQKLVRVGDFGIGSTSVPTLTDLNVFSGSGTYRFGSAAVNTPAAIFGTVQVAMYDQTNWTQLVIGTSSPEVLFTRACVNGAIQPWQRQYTETITNANGTATKFPDGTMICRCTLKDSGAANISIPANLFMSAGIAFTWPVPFVGEAPIASHSSIPVAVASGWSILNTYSTLTGISDVRLIAASTGATSKISVIAMGRWR
ncbi:pyocin knob domain-containing protein [Pseudomonas protegens]|uniref:pyocin knob domain-containing protein n=1 Tax=Pseudomonas protegens TaxID=380021 RepID=UPI00381D9022